MKLVSIKIDFSALFVDGGEARSINSSSQNTSLKPAVKLIQDLVNDQLPAHPNEPPSAPPLYPRHPQRSHPVLT